VAIEASLLAADFGRLAEQVEELEACRGVEALHFDVMDGQFVPNISFGPLLLEALRPRTRLSFTAHLMIVDPDRYLEAFAKAGADTIVIHYEATLHPHRDLEKIRELGLRAGIAINPETEVEILGELLALVDMVVVMSVSPGFGGQLFIQESLEKIAELRGLIQETNSKVAVAVDGGVNANTAAACVQAGATVLAIGSGLFKHPGGVAAAVKDIRGKLSTVPEIVGE